MVKPTDPFHHHPELRDKIADPSTSFFRSFSSGDLIARLTQEGVPTDWIHTDEERDRMRADTLRGHKGDLWIFAYGSLMWDPGFRFAEVRRARIESYARRFIVKDIFGGRGTREAPGLMAALDTGDGCDGLCFRIEEHQIEEELPIVWRREKLGPAYNATFVEAVLPGTRVRALTFVANHEAELIDAVLSRAEQVHYISTGKGFLGTSLEYIDKIIVQFDTLGIRDDEVTSLRQEVEAYMAAGPLSAV